MSARPATSETMPLRLGRLRRHGVVEGERSVEPASDDLAAIGHLAERRRVDGRTDVGRDRLHRREDRHAGNYDADRAREIDGVLHDVALLDQRRIDVDRRVGDEQRARIARRVDGEDMAQAAIRAQSGFRTHDRAHEFLGVQGALHYRLDLALARHRDGGVGGRVAVLDGDDLIRGEIDAGGVRGVADLGLGPDEHGLNEPLRLRLDRAHQRSLVDGMHDGGFQRRQAPRHVEQPARASALLMRRGFGRRPSEACLLQRRHELQRSGHRETAAAVGRPRLDDEAPVFLVLFAHHEGERQRIAGRGRDQRLDFRRQRQRANAGEARRHDIAQPKARPGEARGGVHEAVGCR